MMQEGAGGEEEFVPNTQPHPAPTLRDMASTDADAVAALIRTAFAQQEVVVDPPASALRIDVQDVARLLRAGGGVVALGPGGGLVGACLWSPEDEGDRNGRHLSRLAVAPSWRRRGVARSLVAAIVAGARNDGCGFLTLSTRLALKSNRALFRSLGFEEIRFHAHPGYASPTFVEMRCSLVSPDDSPA
jgi:ribosomal protein S18 acetylase RimI-like enzyme